MGRREEGRGEGREPVVTGVSAPGVSSLMGPPPSYKGPEAQFKCCLLPGALLDTQAFSVIQSL